MAISWPTAVNTKAYGLDFSGGDNVESIEFESGKARTYQKNSIPKKVFSFIIRMIDDGEGSEFQTFISWWDESLKSGALSFTFPNIVSHTGLAEYRPTQSYSATGQLHKEVKFTVEEM